MLAYMQRKTHLQLALRKCEKFIRDFNIVHRSFESYMRIDPVRVPHAAREMWYKYTLPLQEQLIRFAVHAQISPNERRALFDVIDAHFSPLHIPSDPAAFTLAHIENILQRAHEIKKLLDDAESGNVHALTRVDPRPPPVW
jgi:hypothetical protein